MACYWDDFDMLLGWSWHVSGMIMACLSDDSGMSSDDYGMFFKYI